MEDYEDWRIQQRFALATFYYSTNGEQWTNNFRWLTYGNHECTWATMPPVLNTNLINDIAGPGFPDDWTLVVATKTLSNYSNPCEEEDLNDIQMGQYQHLWLQDNGLNGTLPRELFEILTSLKTINLDPQVNKCDDFYQYSFDCDAKLTGRLPFEIGSLTDLEVLSLDYHVFSGQIPPTIGQLSSLQILRLHGSNFTGPLPFQFFQLTNLQFVDLVRNDYLTGTIAPDIGKMTKLKHFWMYRTALTGTIPCEIGNVPLVTFNVWGNDFSGSLCTEFGKLTNLEHMYFQCPGMSGAIPTELGLLTNLTILSLNRVTGIIPPELGELTNLDNLALAYNALSGVIPTALGKLTALRRLLLNNVNTLTGTIPSELGNLLALEWASFFSNRLTGTIPLTLGALATNGSLESLGFERNDLSGTVPSDLCRIGVKFDCSEFLCGCSCACPTMPPTIAPSSSSDTDGNIFSPT